MEEPIRKLKFGKYLRIETVVPEIVKIFGKGEKHVIPKIWKICNNHFGKIEK